MNDNGRKLDKPVVFISHITEEKKIASALKELVESAFLGFMTPFVSSEQDCIGLGDEWRTRIRDALEACVIELVLVSPESVRQPWINFEAGAGWIRDIPVIPLCHSGMTPSTLPQPLNPLQAASADNREDLERLIRVLAKKLDSKVPKRVKYTSFINTVNNHKPKLNMQEIKGPFLVD